MVLDAKKWIFNQGKTRESQTKLVTNSDLHREIKPGMFYITMWLEVVELISLEELKYTCTRAFRFATG